MNVKSNAYGDYGDGFRKKISVIMISLHYPRPSNPASAWFKNQIGAYAEYSNVFLYVPVHITPSINLIRQEKGLIEKLRSLKMQVQQILQEALPDFISPVPGKYVRFLSIPPKDIFPYSGGIILSIRLFFSMIGKRKFDVIHGQGMIHDGLAAVLLGKVFRCPTVVTAIGSDIHAIKKNSVTYKSTLYVLRRATLITTVSGELKQRIVDMGIDERKVKVVPNGVDPDFQKNSVPLNVRHQLNIPQDAKLFGFVGRMIPVKDPMTLLEAFRLLSKDVNNVYLLFVGDGDLKAPILKMAEDFGILDRIRITAGMVQPREIPAYMKSFDYLCLSSVGEGWPNVILEAMICGKPVIGTRVGGVPEAISGPRYGLIVPPQNPQAMAAAMKKALDTQWNPEEITQYARENSWSRVGARYGEIYREVCASHMGKG